MEENIKSILVVGDSLSRGVVFNEAKKRYCFLKDCFVNCMQNLLRPRVYNTAKFGSTVEYGKNMLKAKMEELNPDVVLIEFGGNDCDFHWEEIAKNPSLDHQPKIPLRQFEQALREISKELQDKGKVPVFMNLPPLNAPNYFQWFTGGDEKKGTEILKWLGDVGKIYWWHERYSSTISRVARETGARLVDVRSDFLAEEDYRVYLCRDGIHPNEQGHKLIVNTLIRFIAENARGLFVPQELAWSAG